MAKIRVYRTYNFIDKDPIIDRTRTVLQETLGDKFERRAARLSGVSATTLGNWFRGGTRRPQFATVAAVLSSVGYDLAPKRDKRIDEEAELKRAAQWIAQKRNYAIVPDAKPGRAKPRRKAA